MAIVYHGVRMGGKLVPLERRKMSWQRKPARWTDVDEG